MEIQELHKLFLLNRKISTDTRKIEPNSIYFGLKGANFNGSLFAKEALEKGASYCVVEQLDNTPIDSRIIIVDDVLKTLQDLSTFHRKTWRIPVLAICGSNGKTTSKELIHRVLSKKFKTFSTQGNLNNHIGVPLSILSVPEKTEIVILELGANHQLEHELLLQISQPDYALVTNIGKDHLEGFGGVDGVEKATMEVFDYLKNHNKKLFINKDDARIVRNISGIEGISFNLIETGLLDSSFADYSGIIVSKFPTISVQIFENKTGEEIVVSSNLFGTHNGYNIIAAAAIGKYFGVSLPAIKVAVEEYIPDNNRSQVIEKDSNKYILDAYNANPSSMIGAIKDFTEYPGYNKILILGDMFELGTESEKEHQAIMDILMPAAFENILLVGNEFMKFKSTDKALHFKDKEEVKEYLKIQKFRNMIFFLKGSRGIKLEEVVDL